MHHFNISFETIYSKPSGSHNVTFMTRILGLTTWCWLSNWFAFPWEGLFISLSIPWLLVIICQRFGEHEILRSEIACILLIFFFQILFCQPYCWNFMGIVSWYFQQMQTHNNFSFLCLLSSFDMIFSNALCCKEELLIWVIRVTLTYE